MTVDSPLANSVQRNMETSYDNPMLVTDASSERSTVNKDMNGQSNGINPGARRLDRNSENANGVLAVPPCATGATNHSYTNYVINERNIASTNHKEKEAYSNGVTAKAQKNSCQHDRAYHDYEPHHHYFSKSPTTYLDTVFHLLKASLGTGILAMPNAFNNAGWMLGTLGTMIIGFLCTYNIHLLVRSEYELCKRRKVPSMTFPETVEAALEEGPRCLQWLAPYGKILTNVFLVMYQVGSSSIYVVFMASNFKQVFDAGTEGDINVRWMMLYILAPLIIICWVPNLKLLVPFSTVANIFVLLSFLLIFTYIFNDVPSLSEREPIGSISSIPLFFGTVLFAMEAIGVVMPLKNSMKEPQKFRSFTGVLNASMLPITILYTFIGFFGYLKYGSTTLGSITLNLPQTDILANAVKILYSCSIYITYALSNFVNFDILWTNGISAKYPDMKHKMIWEYVVRTGIVLVTFLLAVAVSDLELFISFTGSFCLSTMGVAVPAIVETLVNWCNRGNTLQFSVLVFKNFILVVIAAIAFTIGVGTSVSQFLNPKHA